MDIHDDDQDRLIDMLLREELGGQRPPQLAGRILERARRERLNIFRRVHPGWIAAIAAAAVAAIAFLVVPQMFSSAPATQQIVKPDETPKETPKPIEPVKEIPKPPQVAQKYSTDKDEKTVVLGGFCNVTLTPNSAIEAKGDGDTQKVVLDRGAVLCDIEPNKGKFSVENQLGNVIVKGTAFRVTVNSEKHGDRTVRSRMTVKVTRGEVVFEPKGAEKPLTLTADQEAGMIIGTVVKNEREWIEVRADGEDEHSRRFTPRWIAGEHGEKGGIDRKMMERLGQFPAKTRVRMLWISEEHERIISIEKAPERDGKVEPRKDGDHKDGDRREGDRKEPERKEGERPRADDRKTDKPAERR